MYAAIMDEIITAIYARLKEVRITPAEVFAGVLEESVAFSGVASVSVAFFIGEEGAALGEIADISNPAG